MRFILAPSHLLGFPVTSSLPALRKSLTRTKSPVARRVLITKLQAQTVRENILTCTSCPLHEARTQAVPFSGPTHSRAELIVVGEAPGFSEDKYGKPFVGKSGRMLDRTFEKVGASREQMFVVNTVCCRPPDNRDPEANETAACSSHFEAQLNLSGLWIGVALGGYAMASVLGVDRSSIRVGDYLDKPVWKNGRVWWGTYHPSYALRNIDARVEMALSFRAALALKHGKSVMPPLSQASNQKERDKEASRVMSEMQLLGKERDDLNTHLYKSGWASGFSEGLGAQILIIGNEDVPIKKRIPKQLLDLPTYTLDELLRIGEAGAGRGGWSRGELRRLHMVREEFGGEIVA